VPLLCFYYISAHLFVLSRFCWVTLQLDSLGNCPSMKSLRQRFTSLPPTLDETYTLILENIDEWERSQIYHILQWICFAEWTFVPAEIAAIMIYQAGDYIQPPFDADDVLFHPDNILGICCRLLWKKIEHPVTAGDSIHEYFELSHFSVKEYLLSSRALSWRLDETQCCVSILHTSIALYLSAMICHLIAEYLGQNCDGTAVRASLS
jgi:hypothetical protein